MSERLQQKSNNAPISLKTTKIDSPLGPMIAIADEASLYLLEFVTKRGLERELDRLQQRGFDLAPGMTPILMSIEAELHAYFAGKLMAFKTPYHVFGSPFQQQVWKALSAIPYGETRSYAAQAASLGKPTAFRAVANANGANQLSILLPCHRVIASDGSLGGYGGGIQAKEWLLNHEKSNFHKKGGEHVPSSHF